MLLESLSRSLPECHCQLASRRLATGSSGDIPGRFDMKASSSVRFIQDPCSLTQLYPCAGYGDLTGTRQPPAVIGPQKQKSAKSVHHQSSGRPQVAQDEDQVSRPTEFAARILVSPPNLAQRDLARPCRPLERVSGLLQVTRRGWAVRRCRKITGWTV